MNWQMEVIELHRFFEAWLLGREETLGRAEAAFHLDFTFIGPDGHLVDRATVLHRLQQGHGSATSLEIETREHRLLHTAENLALVSYVERHVLADGTSNERLSSAVFVGARRGPNGVRWLHVQETWIDPD